MYNAIFNKLNQAITKFSLLSFLKNKFQTVIAIFNQIFKIKIFNFCLNQIDILMWKKSSKILQNSFV